MFKLLCIHTFISQNNMFLGTYFYLYLVVQMAQGNVNPLGY